MPPDESLDLFPSARSERGAPPAPLAERLRPRSLDEIHRLNRAQQDTLLPHVERGSVTLIGATTENPSFEVIAPLLSRCRVFVLERLGEDALALLVRRAADDSARGLGGRVALGEDELAA